MIPKIVHYCWFGRNPLPNSAIKCIKSWKKYLLDYEIKEWNEDNFPITNCPNYAKQAYNKKKWAFVSDYARFKILYEVGGLYFDTDVELIKPIDDVIAAGSFMGCSNDMKVNPGLGLAATPGLGLYKDILDYYNKNQFIDDGCTTIVQIVTEILRSKGFKDKNDIQTIENVNFYPPDYFSPIDYNTGKLHITKNTRSIHHYDGTWLNPKTKFAREMASILRRYFPRRFSGLLAEFIAIIKFDSFRKAISKLNDWCKNKY